MKREEFERMHAVEDQLWWYQALREHALALLGLAGPGDAATRPRILDAGCGTGGMTARLARVGQVFGADLSPFAIAVCRDRRGLAATTVASIGALPFPDRSFDLAVSLDVISDVGTGNDARAVAEIARVLRSGGRLCVNLPAFRWLAGEHDLAVGTGRRYTRSEVRDLLNGAGLVIERLSYWNAGLLPLVALARLASRIRSRAIHEARSDIGLPPAPINRALLALARAEGRLLGRYDLPFGSSILAVARKP